MQSQVVEHIGRQLRKLTNRSLFQTVLPDKVDGFLPVPAILERLRRATTGIQK